MKPIQRKKPISQEIDRQAAKWAAKMDAGALPPEEREAFESWLAADVRHFGAYGRAEAVLARLDRYRAAGGGALSQVSPNAAIASLTRRNMVLGGGIAAGLVAACTVGIVVWNNGRNEYSQEAFTTKIGETRVIVLSDNSVVTLNTNSKITVRYTKHERLIDLVQGEALFSVAKNKSRPFVVSAGYAHVRAVGTSFSVSRLPQHPVQILVQEGVVKVTCKSKSDSILADADTRTLVPKDAPISKRAVSYSQIARNLAWQYGQIAFDNVQLADAVLEFARYSRTKIVVDPAVSSMTVTGLFASNDPVGFAKAVATALNLRLDIEREEIRIIR
jgi:transmembrane sensor